jgi:hypothetical protein
MIRLRPHIDRTVDHCRVGEQSFEGQESSFFPSRSFTICGLA